MLGVVDRRLQLLLSLLALVMKLRGQSRAKLLTNCFTCYISARYAWLVIACTICSAQGEPASAKDAYH